MRQENIRIWDKKDPRILSMRQLGPFYKTYKTYETHKSYLFHPETFANLMLNLCFKQGYFLDKLFQALKEKFIREGGFWKIFSKKELIFAIRKRNDVIINLWWKTL